MRPSHRHRALRALRAAEHPLPLTSMLGVAFLLMISILCATTSRRVEGALDVSLPSYWFFTYCPALPSVELEVRVLDPGARERPDGTAYTESDRVTRRRYEFGADRLIDYRVGALCTEDREDVEELLRRARAWEDFDGRLSIFANAGVTCGEIVGVLEAARAAGFDDVRFSGH